MSEVIEDIVNRLVAGGCAPALAAAAVAGAFAEGVKSGGSPVDAAAEKRRAYDRKRKADKRAASVKSGGSPQEVRGNPVSTISLSSETKDSEIKEVKKEGNSRGTKLPPDWQPNETHIAAGRERGFSREVIDGFAQDMRLWADANSNRSVARKSDWDKTFHGWIRRQKAAGPPRANGRTQTMHDLLAEMTQGQPDEQPLDYDLDLSANSA